MEVQISIGRRDTNDGLKGFVSTHVLVEALLGLDLITSQLAWSRKVTFRSTFRIFVDSLLFSPPNMAYFDSRGKNSAETDQILGHHSKLIFLQLAKHCQWLLLTHQHSSVWCPLAHIQQEQTHGAGGDGDWPDSKAATSTQRPSQTQTRNRVSNRPTRNVGL